MYARSAHRQPYAWFRSGVFLVYLRPDADASNSGWSTQAGGTTNLYLMVDDTSPDDADYVRSSKNPTADIIRFRISDPASPLTQPFNVSYRYANLGTSALTLTVRLKQGTTLIKSWVHTDAAAFKTVTQTLTSGEFATITDLTDLFIEFEAGP